MFILTKTKSLTTPLRTVVHPESLKALKDDIQQERRVQQQHRTESLIALNEQDVTCASHWWGLLQLYMYSIDYIYFLSTTTKHQPEMPDYVNNNISGTSQLLRSTRYQVSRRKKDSERKEKKTK